MSDEKFSSVLASTSVWFMRPDADPNHLRKGIRQLNNESDRAVAIIGGTIVELQLTAALKAFLHKAPKITDELFRTTGALGAFGSKIDLGYLIGLYGIEAHRDLVTIKNIRNAFAHSLLIEDFKSQKIEAWASNLKMAEKHTAHHEVTEWDGSFDVAPAGEVPEAHWLGLKNRDASLANPRERYLLSVQVFCIGLSAPSSTGMPDPIF